MQVQNNIASINAARNQGIETGKLKKSLEKLSSGFRIVRAGDDAAGLAISEGMRSRINSLNQAMKNIDDGIGLTNVGDGALTEVHSMLQRLKTLALKSANGTYDQSNRETLNMERDHILEEIDRIGSTTKFGEISPVFQGRCQCNYTGLAAARAGRYDPAPDRRFCSGWRSSGCRTLLYRKQGTTAG